MENFNSLIERLSDLTSTQIGELRTDLEAKWGIKTQFILDIPQPTQLETITEPTEFVAILTGFSSKMGVIKMIREITGLGLIQAKELVESNLPKEIKAGLTAEDAAEFKRKIEESGGSIEIRPA